MRVIAGALRGRRLVAPRGAATRPTGDRVREAIFSILGDLEGARVLDLYAGTGALGIEALSRGAASAVFVESARPALVSLRANLAALGLDDAARVIDAPVQRALDDLARGRASGSRGGSASAFDLVFADPPYADVARALEAIDAVALAGAGRVLAPSARLVLEHATRDALPPSRAFARRSTRTYGDTSVTFYEIVAPGPDAGSG